jgi:hypothetical protein
MDYPVCFQHTFSPAIGSVETVVVRFEFSPTLQPEHWPSDDLALCSGVVLQFPVAR